MKELCSSPITPIYDSELTRSLSFFHRTIWIPHNLNNPQSRRDRLLKADNSEPPIRFFEQLRPIAQISLLAVVDLEHGHVKVSAYANQWW